MPSKPINFVITGTPRSGTAYLCRVLQALGLDCTHEEYFNPWRIRCESERVSHEPWGDCSWMAAPFLKELPSRTKVFHLVRNPLNTINSIISTGQIDWPTDYRTFAATHCWGDGDYWPTDVAAEAQHFWVQWNAMIEQSGRVLERVQVENVRHSISRIAREIKPDWNIGSEALTLAVDSVATNYNSRPRCRPEHLLNQSELTAECTEMNKRYGYGF